jgi:hypothetical protein
VPLPYSLISKDTLDLKVAVFIAFSLFLVSSRINYKLFFISGANPALVSNSRSSFLFEKNTSTGYLSLLCSVIIPLTLAIQFA